MIMDEELRKSEECYHTVLEAAPDPVVVYDLDGNIIYLNPAFSQVFGWTLRENKGQKINFVPVDSLSDARWISMKIARGETISGIETYRLTKDGGRIAVSISGAEVLDSRGTSQGSIFTIQDISARKQTEKNVKFLAYHDILTGLPNRTSFYLRVEDQLIQSQSLAGKNRRGVPEKWALLFLDLDKFKYVNDTLGHNVGDELLRRVARRLQHALRQSDPVFRLGGDEFIILLKHLIDHIDVAKVAEKLCKEITQPYHIMGYKLHINGSIGISLYPDDGADVEKLVKRADMAMYAAKKKGQGYHFFTEEMNNKTLERMTLENSLQTALHENQFRVYYQPVVDDSNQTIGMEALLRWHHPELGVLSPGQFLPLAEETGAIIPIGKWVLHTACKQAGMWRKEKKPAKFHVAVNLSIRQLNDPNLIATVEQALENTGLPPEYLHLELQENGIFKDPEQVISKIQLLQAKGIHFSIDNFGTGYSSLTYLKRFLIDTLKIDRSFVSAVTTNIDDQEIVKTIMSMAHNLNMNTVAEGVETKEQLDFLAHQGCHMMQGYYFGRPMPPDQFEELFYPQPRLGAG